MKCQNLFSGKIKKNISKCLLKILPGQIRVLMLKILLSSKSCTEYFSNGKSCFQNHKKIFWGRANFLCQMGKGKQKYFNKYYGLIIFKFIVLIKRYKLGFIWPRLMWGWPSGLRLTLNLWWRLPLGLRNTLRLRSTLWGPLRGTLLILCTLCRTSHILLLWCITASLSFWIW